jgi:uncharacterized phiE125 gp8 family phage protein
MGVAVVTPPAAEPVSLAEARRHLRILPNVVDPQADDEIARLIKAARRTFERETNRSIITRTLRLDLERFPCGRGMIRLPQGPVASVTSITWIDEAGDTNPFEAANYAVDLTSDVAKIALLWNATWPVMTPRLGGVSVTYQAGRAAGEEEERQAILLLVGHWWLNTEAASDRTLETIPFGLKSLIDDQKIDQLA